jgi:hypothetical protein
MIAESQSATLPKSQERIGRLNMESSKSKTDQPKQVAHRANNLKITFDEAKIQSLLEHENIIKSPHKQSDMSKHFTNHVDKEECKIDLHR